MSYGSGISVLGSGRSSSLVLLLSKSRILVNCGESTQRIATENKARISKITHVLFTRISITSLGGFPGMFLTLADTGIKSLDIVSPPGIKRVLGAALPFMSRPGVNVKTTIVSEKVCIYNDSELEIHAVGITGRTRRTVRGTTSYLVSTKLKRGKFDIAKALALGIPKNKYKAITKGESVNLEDGRVILSSELMGDPVPAKNYAIVDCIDKEYFDSLFHSIPLGVELVVHYTEANVVEEPEYQCWMNSFSKATQHLLLCYPSTEPVFVSSFLLLQKLNVVSPNVFPLPYPVSHCRTPPDATVGGRNLLTYALYATKASPAGFNYSDCYSDDIPDTPDVPLTSTVTNPQITFLGTGSAIPSKYRNVSSIFLEYGPDSLFMDCGEGTYDQMLRRFGSKGTEARLANLKCIWISHVHADHHLGAITLLVEREKLGCSDPVTVVAPKVVLNWLSVFQEMSLDEFSYSGVLHGDTEVHGLRLESVPVHHCPRSFGVVVHAATTKIVYSGDTRPCNALVEAGKNCDLLIHEATFEDGMEDEAKAKRHSTVSEATEIASKMESLVTVLTHFSQRYPKLSLSSTTQLNAFSAYDLMTFSLAESKSIQTLRPQLELVFEDDD